MVIRSVETMNQMQVPLATRATPDPFGNPTHRTVGIVDANAILSSVDNDCRNNRNSRLLRSTAFNSTTLYAADHVWEEIYRRLPKIAKSSPVPLAALGLGSRPGTSQACGSSPCQRRTSRISESRPSPIWTTARPASSHS